MQSLCKNDISSYCSTCPLHIQHHFKEMMEEKTAAGDPASWFDNQVGVYLLMLQCVPSADQVQRYTYGLTLHCLVPLNGNNVD